MIKLNRHSVLKAPSSILWYRDRSKSLLVNLTINDLQRRIQEISPEEFDFLECLDGRRNIESIVLQLNIDGISILRFLQRLIDQSIETFHIVNSPEQLQIIRFRNGARKLREKADAIKVPPEDVERYHQSEIIEAMDQFDDIEATLSHVFRERHKALNNKSYGEAFVISVLRYCPRPLRILEIGGGVGFFSRDILDYLKAHHPNIYNNLSYTICDLSPALSNSQKRLCAGHLDKMNFRVENMLSFQDEEGFDLVISNEVIADLPSKLFYGMNDPLSDSSAVEYIRKYNLDISSWPNIAFINTGAIQFAENLKNIVSKGGMAILTEYGNLNSEPEPVQLGEHREYSIVFKHIESVSNQLGYQASTLGLSDFMDFDCTIEVITEQSLLCINSYLFPYLKLKKLSRLAYTKEKLNRVLENDQYQIGNIHFDLLSKKNVLSPSQFYALIIKM